MQNTRQKLPPEQTEIVRAALRNLVAAFRQTGHKTLAAFTGISVHIGLSSRKWRHVFEGDREPTREEWEAMRGAPRLLRRIAERLRLQADRWDAEADLLERQQEQYSLDLESNVAA